MSGEVFAIISALTFSFVCVITRRAVMRVVDATAGVLITVPIGVPFFLLVLIASGQIHSIVSFSWQGYVWLSAAGILHFIVGRSLNYSCTQLVGANVTNILIRVRPLVAVTLGVSLLSEPLTWKLAIGVLLIVCGVALTGLNPETFRSGRALFSGIPRRAFILGMSAGVAWGISPILVKLGFGSSGSAIGGAFISYSAATVALSISFWNRNKRLALASMKSDTIRLFCLIGVLSAIAQLMRYMALSLAPASVVSPLLTMTPVFVVVLSFLVNRKLESFSTPVIVGTVVVVVGSILLV